MSLEELTGLMLPAIESELQRQIARLDEDRTRPFFEMLSYHMGWTGEWAGAEARGKRIRPLLLLLSVSASGAEWQMALPAAAAVELVHNFSLIHDDIQDGSKERRGRDTLWLRWGIAQAINAGDALFVLSNQALLDLSPAYPRETVLQAAAAFQQTCLDLTRGQFLDMSYEKRTDLEVEDYWPMVAGKTAALLSFSTAIGSLLGGGDETCRAAYRSFGHYLGLSFQIQDDLLGIWGDSLLTGKSTDSDLVGGKKSLPVLVGLERSVNFSKRWRSGPIQPEEATEIADLLSKEGVRLFVQENADQMTEMSLQFLRAADPQGKAGEALFELADLLLGRRT